MTATTTPAPLPETAHRLSVIVYGVPAPQGSKKVVGRGILIDDNPVALRTWREDVKAASLAALERHPDWERDYPAVVAHMAFTLPRPRAHFRTSGGEPSSVLHEWAPDLHATKPDLDKLLRSTWDALTAAGVYRDDCRLAQVFAVKTYTRSSRNTGALPDPGARITLTGVRRR